MTDVTLGNYLSVYTKAQNQDLAAYIEFDLPRTEQLSTRAYKKPIAPLAYEPPHSRIILQLVFSLLLLTFMASRSGEVIESEGWKDSNEGLLYGHVLVMRQEDHTYTRFALQAFANKHRRRLMLYKEKDDRALCPVTWFLAQALADRVFEGVESIDEMESKEIPPGATRDTFCYRLGKETQPVMRGVCPDGTISARSIWNYNCFSKQIKSLGQRAGYRDSPSA
ncbi:hypothetical protein BDU57DRAFT_560362 [Ampelomyces quisqualis]|uniref:Uncharacterized protein n=1 Tax=Ampelomyces quisqualis TaxID=50730 RepID=A0A6A5Q9X7_AMPQU|nr:hypothetical protein BDU57DRAFT_560362 [Ampelomyces quisqualis]